eukprot:TRINITY_DN678_c0_g1_i7.p1 TRINITY_DN678_c0_g1~~TRINITY_DN678_c0_g1_i7.p1  ORF type:complete len:401 (+),score=65.76 TRINITY_DN678_c0_g1_i7:24-1205(+)
MFSFTHMHRFLYLSHMKRQASMHTFKVKSKKKSKPTHTRIYTINNAEFISAYLSSFILDRSPSQEFDKDEDDDSVENDPFHIYDQTLSRIGIGKFHYQLVAVMGWGNAIDAINLLTVSFIIPELEDEWHFSSYKKGLLSSSIFLGMLFGGWIFSGMADRYGRRPVILCTLVIEAIFSLASSLCHTIDGMIIFRFFSGVGVGGSFPVAFAYFAEFLPLESRGSFIVLLASFWTLGNVLTATMAWIILPMLGWRYFVVICVIPTVICMIMIVTWAPESPRYLLTQNRIEEAQLILRRIAQVCGYHHVINLESLSTQSLPPPNDGQFGSWDVYKQLFSPQLRKTTTSIVLIWVTLSYGFYGLLWICCFSIFCGALRQEVDSPRLAFFCLPRASFSS